MRITIDQSVLDAMDGVGPGAFARAKELEMRGVLADGWYAFLRGAQGGLVPDEELRVRADALAAAGESLPRFEEFDE